MYFVSGGELKYWRSALDEPVTLTTGQRGDLRKSVGRGQRCFCFCWGEVMEKGEVKHFAGYCLDGFCWCSLFFGLVALDRCPIYFLR